MNWKTWFCIIALGLIALGALWMDLPGTSVPERSAPGVVPGSSAAGNTNQLSWLTVEYWGVPLWLIILGGAVIVLAISRLNYRSVSVSFSTGTFRMKVITSFLVLATFFYLLSKVYPNAPLFQPGEGYGHIALYFVLVGLMAMVAANLEGKALFVNLVLVAIMFAMIGHRTAELLDPSGKLSIASLNPFKSGGGQVAATSGACTGIPTTYTYDDPWTEYPLGDASCQKRAYVKEGCVRWLDSNGKPLAETCNGPMPAIDGINYLRPITTAVVITNRCRAFAPGNLVEKCS